MTIIEIAKSECLVLLLQIWKAYKKRHNDTGWDGGAIKDWRELSLAAKRNDYQFVFMVRLVLLAQCMSLTFTHTHTILYAQAVDVFTDTHEAAIRDSSPDARETAPYRRLSGTSLFVRSTRQY